MRTPRVPAPVLGRWGRLRRGCLHALQSGLEFSGLAALYVRFRKVAGATILEYHSVAEADHAPWIDPRYHMSPRGFERQMRFLSKRRNPVSLDQLVLAIEEGRDLPSGSVAVTFDDGYLDHLTVAAPILLKYGIPATFFLPTGYVSRVENQWIDSLYTALRRRTRHALGVHGRPFDLSRPPEERESSGLLQDLFLAATYAERIDGLRNLYDQVRPEGTAPRLTLDWDNVRKLQDLSPKFEIGGHSQDHVDLTAIDSAAARMEIANCAADLRRELGEGPRHFSYPYERWTPAAKDEVRRQGFRSAVGTGPDYLITRCSDRYALPRVDPIARRSTFGFVTSGAFPGLSKALVGRA